MLQQKATDRAMQGIEVSSSLPVKEGYPLCD
jgi:hypothetical protein